MGRERVFFRPSGRVLGISRNKNKRVRSRYSVHVDGFFEINNCLLWTGNTRRLGTIEIKIFLLWLRYVTACTLYQVYQQEVVRPAMIWFSHKSLRFHSPRSSREGVVPVSDTCATLCFFWDNEQLSFRNRTKHICFVREHCSI